jgi:hypothetical protein
MSLTSAPPRGRRRFRRVNPEIAKLYKWSVKMGADRWTWICSPPPGSPEPTIYFANHDEAMAHATQQAREGAAKRVLMALMLAAVQQTAK